MLLIVWQNVSLIRVNTEKHLYKCNIRPRNIVTMMVWLETDRPIGLTDYRNLITTEMSTATATSSSVNSYHQHENGKIFSVFRSLIRCLTSNIYVSSSNWSVKFFTASYSKHEIFLFGVLLGRKSQINFWVSKSLLTCSERKCEYFLF